MALTTHEKIRVESGFQSRFMRQSFKNNPDGTGVAYFVRTDENTKIVPEFGTGNTVAGVSDVEVWLGLSGINGSSRLAVSSVDADIGSVTIGVTLGIGSSLTINYSSSSLPSRDIENARLRAESIVNQRLSLCYDMPVTSSSSVESLASRLASALLLIRGYGTGSVNTAQDGYQLYEMLMGKGEAVGQNNPFGTQVGEIGMICTPGYQLVDDSGQIILRNDDETTTASTTFVAGGRVRGRLYDITEEQFRYKEQQSVADTNQTGSGNNNVPVFQN